ncbi:MAG TPA: M23 family metallopeptidase, partial [Mycobacteriales bacterium]|nr:M23 family metallopeptidase [Mycobacteriales bacterium]
VVSAGWEGGYGKAVRIRHKDGTQTLYAHLSSISVGSGERVSAGQRIGREGSTGNSTGPHLHFEVRVGGNPVNPLRWLRNHGVAI